MPKRIQRKRTKGWRMPENAVSVTRPGKYGNPYRVGSQVLDWTTDRVITATEENILKLYEEFCRRGLLVINPQYLEPLRGKDLACFCKEGAPCHADVLLRLANE